MKYQYTKCLIELIEHTLRKCIEKYLVYDIQVNDKVIKSCIESSLNTYLKYKECVEKNKNREAEYKCYKNAIVKYHN